VIEDANSLINDFRTNPIPGNYRDSFHGEFFSASRR
jgi:hypothetical protein